MLILLIGHEDALGTGIAGLPEAPEDWRVRHAHDATEALRLLAAEVPDAVVTELHPLGIDGVALLGKVASRCPDAIRLVLLGEDEAGAANRALTMAHRLLHKPLRSAELVEAIDSLAELRELLDSDVLKAAVGRLERLPPPPQLFLRLRSAVADPDASMAKLADIVSQDPVTAARVLRICNSAYFSSGRAVTDVRNAVVRLGQQELQRLVLAVEAFADGASSVDREALRQRSLVASQLAAAMIGGASADMAATAALLAEVGMLLPGVALPAADGTLLGDGPHYAEAGAYLLGLWGLPMPIVEAVAQHHRPARAGTRGFWLGGAVHVARALAAGQPVDEGYLGKVGVLGRLPEWRRMAAELGARFTEPTELDAPVIDPTPPADAEAGRSALARLPLLQFEADDVHYLLLGVDGLGADAVDAIDHLLASQHPDALALDLCPLRLHAGGRAPAWQPPRLGALLRDRLDPVRLGHCAQAVFGQRLREQFGIEPGFERSEAIDLAERRGIALWALDRSTEQTLASAVAPLGLLARWTLARRLVRAGRQLEPLAPAAQQALRDGDPIACALSEAGLDSAPVLRACCDERQDAMAATLLRRVRHHEARRVLVVLAVAHVAALGARLQHAAGARAARLAAALSRAPAFG